MPVLANKTIGFVGYGDIAKQSAKAAKLGFGMEIRALRRSPFAADEVGNGALVDVAYDTSQLTQLFAECDFVVSTLPGTSATRNMIGKEQIGAMKSTGVFISCGRGTVVDEDAVAVALREGRIGGAALDVFQIEPLPKESSLWGCPNLLITAHNADMTDDFFDLGWKVWRRNLNCFLAGEPLATPVDKDNGY
jgi:phosphoglycerate dehydrogenase-like enzyme